MESICFVSGLFCCWGALVFFCFVFMGLWGFLKEKSAFENWSQVSKKLEEVIWFLNFKLCAL